MPNYLVQLNDGMGRKEHNTCCCAALLLLLLISEFLFPFWLDCFIPVAGLEPGQQSAET